MCSSALLCPWPRGSDHRFVTDGGLAVKCGRNRGRTGGETSEGSLGCHRPSQRSFVTGPRPAPQDDDAFMPACSVLGTYSKR